jgi:hypothetical protein
LQISSVQPTWAIDRDREAPYGLPPPTPPGIRVRTTAVQQS